MGLDVIAYRKLQAVDALFDAKSKPIDRQTGKPITHYFQVNINPDFPKQADDLTDNSVWHYRDSFSFQNAYGYFNQWREELAKLAGYPLAQHEELDGLAMRHAAACWNGTTGPFSELIYFSDCQGVIGSVTSAKLVRDFIDFDEQAEANGDDFYDAYLNWQTAFEMAADGGAVELL